MLVKKLLYPLNTVVKFVCAKQIKGLVYHSHAMSKTALVILSSGAEEMETVISIDVLRRGGIEVTVAGLNDENPVKCSRDVVIKPDSSLKQASKDTFDVIVLPGGLGGAKAMAASTELGALLKQQEKAGGMIAAVCAAPTALKAHSIYLGKNLTSYPSMADEMCEGGIYNYKTANVVVDGNLITSRGPGTCFEFALTIVENLVGAKKAKEIAKGMLLEF